MCFQLHEIYNKYVKNEHLTVTGDMELDEQQNWLKGVTHIPSPNYDERPADMDIDLLVIHSISLPPCEFGGEHITALFTNTLDKTAHACFPDIAHLRVSSHLLIRRTGEVIQYVPFTKRAWHAGHSCFQHRTKCNDFSIGIELEGCDEKPYTDSQYNQLATVTRILQQAFPKIRQQHIVGHCHIAPTRKTDPGEFFEWDRFFNLL